MEFQPRTSPNNVESEVQSNENLENEIKREAGEITESIAQDLNSLEYFHGMQEHGHVDSRELAEGFVSAAVAYANSEILGLDVSANEEEKLKLREFEESQIIEIDGKSFNMLTNPEVFDEILQGLEDPTSEERKALEDRRDYFIYVRDLIEDAKNVEGPFRPIRDLCDNTERKDTVEEGENSSEQPREQLKAQVEALKESFKGYVKKYAEFIAKKEDTTLEELQSRPNGYLSNLIREAWKSYSSEMITDPQDNEAPFELIEADRVLESIIKEAGGEIDLIRVSNNPEQKITSINNPFQFEARISQEDNEYFLETTGYRAKEGQTIPSRVPIISKSHFNKKYLGENQGIVTRCLVFQDKEGNWVADIIAAPTLENTNSNNNNNGSIDFVANRVMDSSMKTEIVDDPEVEEQIKSFETPEEEEYSDEQIDKNSSAIVLANQDRQEQSPEGDVIDLDLQPVGTLNTKSESNNTEGTSVEEIIDVTFEENEIEPNDQETAIVLTRKIEEVGEDVIVVLDEEETFTQDSEDLDKINQEISTLEAEIQRLKDEEEKVDQSKKEGIKAEYKKLEKQLLEKKREKVRIENAEYINRKLEDLQTIKKRLDAVRNGEALDESRTDLPSDLESLQVLYQKEFTKTVNILAGLHMREEMKNLYKSQFDHIIKEYDEAEAAEESKVVTGFKALAKKWKSIPAHHKIVVGLGLGVVAGFGGGGAVIAGAAGFGLTAMKGMSVTSTWVGMDSWTQQRLEKGRIDEVKAKIQSLKKDNSDARSVIELMALATTTRELTGKEVLSQDELNEILELSAKKFTQKAESDVKIDDEKGLAKLNEKINNQEDAPTGGVNIEGQHVYTEISAVADYKQEQQERLNKNKREKFINRYVKSGGVALGVAFSGEILRGSFEGAQAMFDSAENGIESAVDSVPDLNFEGASSDGGDVGINDFDRNVSTEATSPSFDAGAGGNTPEAVQVGEVFGGNTYASRFGDIEVGRISEVLSERFPNDVISFDSGDTVSGELKPLLADFLKVEPDADMLAEASYAFLTTHEGKLQLYELVSATETGREALNHMGYTSLETFMDASPDFEEIMDLSEHMGTGELVGLKAFVENMEAESIFGINEVQDYTSPFEGKEGVTLSDRGVITSIDYAKAGITPEQITQNVDQLESGVEVVFSGSSPQISDRFRFIMSEALDVPWVKVDYNVAAPVMQEYFFQSDVGAEWVYNAVMSKPDNPGLQDVKGYLESFATLQGMSLEDLGSEQNKHLIKSALAGPNQGQYGTRLTAILAGMSRSIEPGQTLQIPNLKNEIARILTSKVTT